MDKLTCKELILPDFEAIFKNHYSGLFKYALSFTGDPDQAKDVISDVFLQFWTNREKLTITISLKSYLFSMVKHQALQQVRQHKLSLHHSGEYLSSLAPDQPGPLEKYLSNQSTAFLEKLISQLPKLRQEIIELKMFGLTNREIAETLNITEKKVEYQLGQAIEILRFEIKKAQLDQRLVLETLAYVNIIITLS